MARIYSDDTMGALRELLEEDVLGWVDVQVRKMFGCPGYRRGGTLFAFLRDEGIVLLLPPDARRRWAEELGGKPFSYPSSKGEMLMQKWLQVPFADEGDIERIRPALQEAYVLAALKSAPMRKKKTIAGAPGSKPAVSRGASRTTSGR